MNRVILIILNKTRILIKILKTLVLINMKILPHTARRILIHKHNEK